VQTAPTPPLCGATVGVGKLRDAKSEMARRENARRARKRSVT
jgi:hypothetical protein